LKQANFVKFLLAILLVFLASTVAYAEWQINLREWKTWLCSKPAYRGSSVCNGPDYRGHFATKQRCEKARKSFRNKGDLALYNRSTCVGFNSSKGGSGGGAPLGGGGGHVSSEAFAKHMILSNMLGSLFQAALAPPQIDNAYQKKLIQQKKAAQKAAAIKKEQERQKNLRLWQDIQNKSAKQLKAEEGRKVKAGTELHAMLDTSGSRKSLSMEPISGGNLEGPTRDKPATIKNELQRMGTGRYDTSALSLQKRQQCAKYFSQRAFAAAKNENDENAKYLNEQAQKVISGQMTDIECQFSELPEVPEPPKPQPPVNRKAVAYYESLIKSVQNDIVSLGNIEVKMRGIETKIKQAEDKKRQAEQSITEVKDLALTAKKPGEKQKCNDLLAQAHALLKESQNDIQAATDARQALSHQKVRIVTKLKEIHQKTQSRTIAE
jgi:hypothetical protein